MIFLTFISFVLPRILTYALSEFLIVYALLLIAVAVIAHSSKTESVAFY
jgi:hypothetical protein